MAQNTRIAVKIEEGGLAGRWFADPENKVDAIGGGDRHFADFRNITLRRDQSDIAVTEYDVTLAGIKCCQAKNIKENAKKNGANGFLPGSEKAPCYRDYYGAKTRQEHSARYARFAW